MTLGWLLGVATLALQTPQPAAPPADAAGQAYFLFVQGRMLEDRGDVNGAIAAYRKAIDLSPKSADLYAELASLFAREGRGDESIAQALAALKLDPDNQEAHRTLGLVQASMATSTMDAARQKSLAGEAIGHLEQALKGTAVPDLNALLTLGRMYVRAEKFPEAIKTLNAFLDDQPGYPEAMSLLGEAYEDAGQIPQAIGVVEALVAAQPEDPRSRAWLGGLYEENDRYLEAAAVWGELAKRNPKTATFQTRQAAALVNGGKLDDGRQQLRDVTKTFPSDATAWYMLSVVERQSGNLPGAEDAARKAIDLDPRNPRGALALASALQAQNKYDDAEKQYRSVLAADPKNAEALNDLGYMFAERGQKLDEAVDLLSRALVIDPDNPSFLDSLGWAYFKQAKLDRAQAPLERAAAALPKNSVILDHLGELYFQLKQYAQAMTAWDHALAGDRDGIDVPAVTKKRDRAKTLAGK